MLKRKNILTRLAVVALFTAVAIVADRFLAINLPSMKIGVTFLPLMLCGMLFGPFWGGVCGALTDFIGATLFPFGPYFPGFTAVAFLSGVLFGLCGRAAEKIMGNIKFVFAASGVLLAKEVLCSLLLNTLWISILYGSPYRALLITRIPVSVVTVVLEIGFAVLLKAGVLPRIKKAVDRIGE